MLADAALLTTMAALVSAALALVSSRQVAVTLPVLLDLLLAAGLLRLADTRSLTTIATVAGLLVVKRLAGVGISISRRPRAGSPRRCC